MNATQAIDRVLEYEGGYTNNPKDPGGETNYGITLHVARQYGYHGSMREIPLPLVREIYQKRYWNRCQCDQLPEILRYAVFDTAVHHGPGAAVKLLQRVAGTPADGIIGPATLKAVTEHPLGLEYVLRTYLAERLLALVKQPHFLTFGKGWTLRIVDILGCPT